MVKSREYKNFETHLIPCPQYAGAFLFVKIICISRTSSEYAIIIKTLFFFIIVLNYTC